MEDDVGLEVGHQPAITLRLVDRREIGALQVLDQGELQRVEIVEAAHDDRHLVQLRLLRRAPAALAGDDLVGDLLAFIQAAEAGPFDRADMDEHVDTAGIEVRTIKDVTPIPHNGCRPPKKRRV